MYQNEPVPRNIEYIMVLASIFLYQCLNKNIDARTMCQMHLRTGNAIYQFIFISLWRWRLIYCETRDRILKKTKNYLNTHQSRTLITTCTMSVELVKTKRMCNWHGRNCSTNNTHAPIHLM